MAISEDSIWLKTKTPSYPKTEIFDSVDVAIIGGGIAGLTTAYLLSKSNLKVAVYEKYKVANGTSGYTTAMITQYVDTDLSDLVRMYGKKSTQKIWDSGSDAINLIEKITRREKFDAEFSRVSYYIYAKNTQQARALKSEHAVAKNLGINLDYYSDSKLSIPSSGYLLLKNQAKFHPVAYLSNVAKIANQNGVKIYEQTEVKDLGQLKAKSIVVTTHWPFNKPFELFFKKARYKTYMLYAKIPKDLLSEGLYQDSGNPYHYIRVDKRPQFDTILIGGEDHRADIPINPTKNYTALEKYLKSIVSPTKINIIARWDGPIIESIDGLPYIGSLHGNDNIFYATGFSGNGMTWGTLAGIILSDLVQGKKNKYESLYNAKRLPSISQLAYKFRDYSQIFINGAVKNMLTSK